MPFLGMLGSFSGGARILTIVAVTIVGLACAGILGARAAGTALMRPALRVVAGGSAAMAITAMVGQLAGVAGV